MTYPHYFPEKYRYKPKPIYRQSIKHFRKNKHHYHFIALCITLGLLSALAITLATKH